MKILLFFLTFVTLFLCGCSSREEIIQENFKNQAIAQDIIEAINSYKMEFGSPPDSLCELLPNYLETIPKTISGKNFEYFTSDLDGYILCFDKDNKFPKGCCYLDSFQSWDCSAGNRP